MNDLEELDSLMGALREGTIEDAQVARLDQLLAEHPEALDRFVDMARLRADLQVKLGHRKFAPLPAVPRGRRLAMGIAAAIVIGIGALVALSMRTSTAETALSYDGCAVLARALDPKWEGTVPRRVPSAPRADWSSPRAGRRSNSSAARA